MKIALVSPYALSVFGGVQEQVLGMSRELTARGHEVLVVAPDGDDRTTYDTPATVQRFGSLFSIPANGSRAPLTLSRAASVAARQAVRSFAPDVVHFHEPFAPRVGYATLRAHEFPSVATFHRNGEGPAVSLTRPLLRRLARTIEVSAAVSPTAASTAREACGADPEVLFNGFEMDRFSMYPRSIPATPTLITVGRLEERKGVAVAIEAVQHHNARCALGDEWRLLIVGDGPQRSALMASVTDGRISFVGAVSDEEKRRILREASAALCPALHGESFGLVLLEAMASSVPVVASDIPGYAQAASSHAALFRVGDVADMERAIATALAATPASLDAAREHARGWSMATLVDRYVELYEEAKTRYRAR